MKIPHYFQEWREFFSERNLRAAVDFPASFFWKEISDAHPEAKVILTTRETDKWCKSIKETIFLAMRKFNEFPLSWGKYIFGFAQNIELAQTVCFRVPKNGSMSMLGSVGAGNEKAREFFESWNKSVCEKTPQEKLLTFQVNHIYIWIFIFIFRYYSSYDLFIIIFWNCKIKLLKALY